MLSFFKKILNKKNEENDFVLSRFLSSTILFSVLHTSLICCVIIQYVKDNGMLPLQISMIIISKRVLRLFCDTFFGLIFDRFGAKILFLIGRILKLISYVILLKFPNFYGFVIAMLLDGASYSSIYGKINSYIYNNLSATKNLKSFPTSISLYYFCVNCTISLMTFFAGILLKKYEYNVIIYISIITNLFSILFLLKFIPDHKDIKQFQVKKMKDIFITLKTIIKTKPQFINLIIIYSIVSFLAWQFHSISSLILLDLGVSSIELAMYGSVLKLVMGIGSIVSIIFFSRSINVKNCIHILSLIIIFGIISSIIYNKYIFYAFCLAIAISYTTLEVCIEKNFEFYSDKTIRGTAISLAMTCCNIISMTSTFFIGVIAQNLNYHIGIIILLVVLFLIVFYISVKINKQQLFN